MKILHLLSGIGVNGAVTYCQFVCDELSRRGHDVSVLCRPESWISSQFDDRVTVIESKMNRSFFELRRLARWIREHQIQLLHSHMTRAHNFGVFLSWMTGVPVIATAHSQSFQLHWRFNDFVIANSNATREFHRRVNRVSRNKIETVYCFSDLERFQHIDAERVDAVRREIGINEGDFVVGMVGSVDTRKGPVYLVEAIPDIIPTVPNLKVVLVGPSDENSNYVQRLRKKQRADPEIDRRVIWLGVRKDIPELMSVFDVTAVPSLDEPLGLVAIESFAAGTPVVAANVGGLPEIVQPQSNGILVPKGNTKELANAVIELASDPRLRERFAAVGKAMVVQRFDPHRLTDQVAVIYEDIVANGRRTASVR